MVVSPNRLYCPATTAGDFAAAYTAACSSSLSGAFFLLRCAVCPARAS